MSHPVPRHFKPGARVDVPASHYPADSPGRIMPGTILVSRYRDARPCKAAYRTRSPTTDCFTLEAALSPHCGLVPDRPAPQGPSRRTGQEETVHRPRRKSKRTPVNESGYGGESGRRDIPNSQISPRLLGIHRPDPPFTLKAIPARRRGQEKPSPDESRAREYLQRKVPGEYERKYRNSFVVIDIGTEEIWRSQKPEKAFEAAKKKAPEGIFYLIRVGSPGAFRMSYTSDDVYARAL